MNGRPSQPGAGLLLTSTAIGTSYDSLRVRNTPKLAFRPGLSGGGLVLSRGYVAGRMPTINGVPIAPIGRTQPVLTLNAGLATATGESWVCVEVHPADDGTLPADSKIEIVHRNSPVSRDPALGRHPLCVVLWRGGRPWQVHQITHFNLGYERVLPPAGAGAVRHLFP